MNLFKKSSLYEKPRERLLKYGVESLSFQELLALILGRGVKKQSVFELSQQILLKYNSFEALSEASIEDLITIKGIGLAKACQLKACFEIARRLAVVPSSISKEKTSDVSPQDIYLQVRQKILNYHKEHFLVVSLDNTNKIIAVDVVSVGILNSSLVHPRETFEIAIKHHAAQIIICHNHPSEELIPSEDDLKMTKRLIEVGKIVGIPVLDHLIISKKSFFSFAKEGLI